MGETYAAGSPEPCCVSSATLALGPLDPVRILGHSPRTIVGFCAFTVGFSEPGGSDSMPPAQAPMASFRV